MNADTLTLIQYRLRLAEETFEDAKYLSDDHRSNSCANRLYYACFYAVSALLLTQGLKAKTHTGIRSLFHQHFIRTGIIPTDIGDIYATLFQQRNETDYEDMVETSPEDIPALMKYTTIFIEIIGNIIQRSLSDESA